MAKNPGINISIILLLTVFFFAFQFDNGLTPSQERGKLIYTKGLRSSGEVITVQLSGAKFDAKLLPCVNCHGRRGIGNPEGGVEPSPLDWQTLTKSYNLEFKNGRKRSSYNFKSLKEAIVNGIDPNGNELDLVMPRYSFTDQDVSDLISYLKIIDKEDVEGVTDTSIHIGVILPSLDHPTGRSKAILNTMKAYLDLVNSGGGLYNRKFLLTEFVADSSPEQTEFDFHNYLTKNEFFAFIGSDLEWMPSYLLSELEEQKIPIIGLITGNPWKNEYLKNRYYYLFSGIDNEAEHLYKFARKSLNANVDNFVVLFNSNGKEKDMFQNKYLDSGFKSVDISTYASDSKGMLTRLKEGGVEGCFFLGNEQESLSFIEDLDSINWNPNVLMSGKLAKSSWLHAPSELDGKIYLSFPTWSTERNEKAMQQYKKMATIYDLDDHFINGQLHGLAATILFTEVLKLSDKDISPESMFETLHDLHNFETGFVAPLSYGPNRRIGSDKVYIVKTDLTNRELKLLY